MFSTKSAIILAKYKPYKIVIKLELKKLSLYRPLYSLLTLKTNIL